MSIALILALTSCTHQCTPVSVPDTIVFQSAPDATSNSQIYAINADGTNPRRVTNDMANDWQPALSPGSLKIAYPSASGGNHFDMMVNFLIGGAPQQLTHNMNTRGGRWGGNILAFSASLDAIQGEQSDIFVVRVDGVGLKELTARSGSNVEPAFSPDGKKIVFTSTRDGPSNIYIMDADGSNQTRLTDSPASDAQGSFSPDGKHIAFWSSRLGNGAIFIMNVDGTGQTPLTDGVAHDFEPVFSRDTNEIAFSSDRETAKRQIYILNIDTKQVRRLTHDQSIDRAPDWNGTLP